MQKRHRKQKSELEHDRLFRGVFSIRPLVQVHLEDALPPEAAEVLNLDSLLLCSDSHVDGNLKAAFSDVVWKCGLRQGAGEVLITLLFEHKSDLPEQPIFVQLLQYLLGIWQKDLAEKRPLSFVLPVIVYHGQRNWELRTFWDYFEGLPTALRRYLPEFGYVLTDLARVPDEIIRTKTQMGALRSVYLAFKHTFDEAALLKNFRDIFIFVGSSGNPYLDILLVEMLFNYVQKRMAIDDSELLQLIATLPDDSKEKIMSTYDKIIAKGQQIGKKQGIEQGIEQGATLKTRQFVTSLIQSTDWADDKIALVANADLALVQSIRAELANPSSC